jgi:CheY-like chemotaxis protein
MALSPDLIQKYHSLLERFVGTGNVVIADSNQNVRGAFAKILSLLGLPGRQLKLATSREDLKTWLQRSDIRIVITDIEWIEVATPTSHQLVIACGTNLSPAWAAKCAELGVDLVLVKPFTLERVVISIAQSLASKLKRPMSLEWMRRGQMARSEGRLTEAMTHFNRALEAGQRDPLPKYIVLPPGSQVSSALDRLASNRLEYQVQLELFKTLAAQGRSQDAYQSLAVNGYDEVMTPEQFADLVCLAVRTQNFNDLDRLYTFYLTFEQRPDRLVRAMVAGLVVSGKSAFRKGQRELGLERFRRVVVSGGHDSRWLDEIMRFLLDGQWNSEASEILTKYPSKSRSELNYKVMEYELFNRTAPVQDVIQSGWQLIHEGYQHPRIYQVLIDRLEEVGWRESAENLKYQLETLVKGVDRVTPSRVS